MTLFMVESSGARLRLEADDEDEEEVPEDRRREVDEVQVPDLLPVQVVLVVLDLDAFFRPAFTLSTPSRSSHTSPMVPWTSSLPSFITPYTMRPQLDTACTVSASQARMPEEEMLLPPSPRLAGAPLRRDLDDDEVVFVELREVRDLAREEELRRLDTASSDPPAQASSPVAPPRTTCSLLRCVSRLRSCGAILFRVWM